MSTATKAQKITVHRTRVPIGNTRFYATQHDVHIGGEVFAHISSISATTSSWRVEVLDPYFWTGTFYGLAEARAWALEMAQRKLDPSRGPIVSTLGKYGDEQRVTLLDGEEEKR